MQLLPEIVAELCTGCGECVAACRPGALAIADGKAIFARPDLCEYDGHCEPVCPEGAISVPYVVVFAPAMQDGPE